MFLLWHFHHHHSSGTSLGDVLAVLAVLVAWIAYRQARYTSTATDVKSAIARLDALRERFFNGYGKIYFDTNYTPELIKERAKQHRGNLEVVFRVPHEPFVALATEEMAVGEGLISQTTTNLAAYALWQITKFNELVRQHTIFNAVHAPDFKDNSLPDARREAVYDAGETMMDLLHSGIGMAQRDWFDPLKTSIEDDIAALKSYGRWRTYTRWKLEIVGDVVLTAITLAVLLTYLDIL